MGIRGVVVYKRARLKQGNKEEDGCGDSKLAVGMRLSALRLPFPNSLDGEQPAECVEESRVLSGCELQMGGVGQQTQAEQEAQVEDEENEPEARLVEG